MYLFVYTHVFRKEVTKNVFTIMTCVTQNEDELYGDSINIMFFSKEQEIICRRSTEVVYLYDIKLLRGSCTKDCKTMLFVTRFYT